MAVWSPLQSDSNTVFVASGRSDGHGNKKLFEGMRETRGREVCQWLLAMGTEGDSHIPRHSSSELQGKSRGRVSQMTPSLETGHFLAISFLEGLFPALRIDHSSTLCSTSQVDLGWNVAVTILWFHSLIQLYDSVVLHRMSSTEAPHLAMLHPNC